MISFNLYSFLFIGYEYLQEVIMTHLQHTYSRVNSKNSTAFPLLPGLLRQDINLEGQFILKPRYSAISQQQSKSSTFLQVPSQLPFQFCIKYQCMLTLLLTGRALQKTNPIQYAPGLAGDLYILTSSLNLIFWENIPFVPDRQSP